MEWYGKVNPVIFHVSKTAWLGKVFPGCAGALLA